MLLALYPQISFRLSRGGDWNGMHAYAHGDEAVYAAYVNALIDGRPRRNDPYTGRDDAPPHAPQAESYFSIQFVPPYAIALIARIFGASLSQSFIALTCFAALLSSLAIFRLIVAITGDERVAAAGVLVVLCFGSVHLLLEYALGFGASNNYLPFLRRYLPSAPFPFFFIFCALIWTTLTTANVRTAWFSAASTGLVFAVLVYSYFYLWTTAAAWASCFALLWLVLLSGERRRSIKLFALIATLAVAALLPYFALLSNRVATTDDALLLTMSHAPDLLRPPELIGLAVLTAFLLSARRDFIAWRDRGVIFTVASALTPFVVFNQQIITGRSLQPFHYGMFVVNYVAILAALLCAVLVHRGWRNQTDAHNKSGEPHVATQGDMQTDTQPETSSRIPSALLVAIALAAFCSGALETWQASRRFMQANIFRDEARPAALRLAALARRSPDGKLDTTSLVLATDYTIADALPTVAPQPVLWSPHMFNFPGVSLAEDKERMAHYLYLTNVDFSDVDATRLDALDNRRKYFVTSLISRSRHNPNLKIDWKPISPAEVSDALRFYAVYVATFDAARATRHAVSYVLTSTNEHVDFSNFDRWYERDGGERVGSFTLYRVKLREAREP